MKSLLNFWWLTAIPIFIGALGPSTVAGPSYAIACFGVITVSFLSAPFLYDRDCGAVLRGSIDAWKSPTALALAVFFAVALLGLAVSSDPARSAGVWFRTILYLAASAMIWRYLKDNPEALEKCFRCLLMVIVLGAITALLSLYLWLGLIGIITLQGPDIPITTARQALKSHTITLCCLAPIVCWLAWRRGSFWKALAVAYPFVVYFISIGANKQAAVMTLLSGLIGMGFAWVLSKLKWKSALLLIILCGFIVLSILGYLWSLLPTYPAETYGEFRLPLSVLDAHRQIIWAYTLFHILENFWTGIGLDVSNFLPNAKDLIPHDNYKFLVNAEYLPSHPHNFILEVWLETGVFGIIALFTAVGTLLWAIYKRLREGYPGAIAATGVYAAFWNANLYNFSFWSSWWLIFFFSTLAMLFATPLSSIRKGR